jgi:Tol biopolymer transport system component
MTQAKQVRTTLSLAAKKMIRSHFRDAMWLVVLVAAGVITLFHTTVSAQNVETPTIMFEGMTDPSRFDSIAIFSVNADGTNLKRLSADGDHILNTTPRPEWSLDGQRIAYVNWLQGLDGGFVAVELYVMDRDGGNRRLLLHVGENFGQRTQQITGVAWSPDGKTLAVTRLVSGLFLVPTNGEGEPRLVLKAQLGRDFSSPIWSPDGKRIAVYAYMRTFGGGGSSQTSEVHVVNADGSDDMTVGKSVVQTRIFQEAVPIHWSSDGNKVFFPLMVLTPGGTMAIRACASNADGSGEMKLTERPAYMAVSPDGSRIAFAKAQPGSHKEIFVANEDGSGVRQVTNDPNWACTTSEWSPDGKRLVVSCHFVRDPCQMAIGCNWRIFMIAADNPPAKLAPIINRDAVYPSVAPGP